MADVYLEVMKQVPVINIHNIIMSEFTVWLSVNKKELGGKANFKLNSPYAC
jgi:hypothetical protein